MSLKCEKSWWNTKSSRFSELLLGKQLIEYAILVGVLFSKKSDAEFRIELDRSIRIRKPDKLNVFRENRLFPMIFYKLYCYWDIHQKVGWKSNCYFSELRRFCKLSDFPYFFDTWYSRGNSERSDILFSVKLYYKLCYFGYFFLKQMDFSINMNWKFEKNAKFGISLSIAITR